MFKEIDYLVIAQTEKLCHWFQRLTGKTNFYLAGLADFLIALVLVGAWFEVFPKEFLGKQGVIIDLISNSPVFCWLLIAGCMLGAVYLWQVEEELAYDRLKRGLANPRKISPLRRIIRLTGICVIPLMYVLDILSGGPFGLYDKFLTLMLVFYFILEACDPLPPCNGKIKDWVKGLRQKPMSQVLGS